MSETDSSNEKTQKGSQLSDERDSRLPLEKGFMLGPWRIEPMAGRFEKDGARLHVEPKVMDVLLCLARTQGEVVSREKLFNEVWSGLVVSDEVLTRAISELRTLLNDTSRERLFIRTVPKRGYALIAAITPLPQLEQHGQYNQTNQSNPGSDTNTQYFQEPKPTQQNSEQQKSTQTQESTARPQDTHSDTTTATPNGEKVKTGFALFAGPVYALANFVIKTIYRIVYKIWRFFFSIFRFVGILILMVLGIVILTLIYGLMDGESPVDIEFEEDSNGHKTLRVSPSDSTEELALPPPGEPPSEEIPTLAIMPFINLSVDDTTNFFSEGLSEDIRSELISLPGLKVVARTSSEAFKNRAMDVRDIGEQLGVSSLLEGTVRVHDQNARITLQLTNTESGFPFWSDNYDYKIDDIFTIQKRIAEAVVKLLAPELLPKLPALKTVNPEAHRYYLLGRHFWHQRTERSIALAIENLTRGLEIDPNYARLHSALADAYIFSALYGELSKEEAANLARPFIKRALELDSDLPEAYASKGLLHEVSKEFKLALDEYKHAVTLNPNNTMALMWYGNALSMSEDVAGANEQYEKALELDPLHPVIQQNFLYNLLTMGKGQQAADMAKAMHEVSGEERLLKPMLHALSKMGQFDSMLEFLVRYNFSEKYQDVSILMVAEALINLKQFEQAKSLLANQKSQALFEGKSLMIAKLAVAQRDSAALNTLVKDLDDQNIGEDEKSKLSTACIVARKTAWLGLANFMESNYSAALNHFLAAEKEDYLACDFGEDRRISLLLYIAETHRLSGDTKTATHYFDSAKARIDRALDLGWGKTYTQNVLLAYYMLTEQTDEIAELLELLKRENIQPWSELITNPIVDKYLNTPENAALLAPFQKHYQKMIEQSRAIPLAKYGIE